MDHLFSTYVKFSAKLILFTTWSVGNRCKKILLFGKLYVVTNWMIPYKKIAKSSHVFNYSHSLAILSGKIYIVIICHPVSNVIIFEIYFSFLIKPSSYMTKKVTTKIWIFSEPKKSLWWNKKHYSSFLKSLHLSK